MPTSFWYFRPTRSIIDFSRALTSSPCNRRSDSCATGWRTGGGNILDAIGSGGEHSFDADLRRRRVASVSPITPCPVRRVALRTSAGVRSPAGIRSKYRAGVRSPAGIRPKYRARQVHRRRRVLKSSQAASVRRFVDARPRRGIRSTWE